MSDSTKPAMYLRVGRADEFAESNVERQAAGCRNYAATLGWPEPLRYADVGAPRTPDFSRLVEAAAAGAVTHLVMLDFDRLPRIGHWASPLQAVEIHSAREGLLAPVMLRIVEAFAGADPDPRMRRRTSSGASS